ncbi:MAG: division/cell wall cluster transcriptional repressor MraZ [Pseudomonadota bacterium]
MQARGIFQGYGLQGVDDKGRVAIPAALRQVVEANNPRTANGDVLRTLTIAPSETDTCLLAYDQGYAAILAEELAQRASAVSTPGAPVERHHFRIGNGMADVVAFDQSGRFVLQGYPRKFSGIGKAAMFIAVGPYFEIWDPQTLLAERGDDRRLRGLVEYLLEERGA